MANVKVAIRVRPLNSRESLDGGRFAVQVEDKVVRVRNVKLEGRLDGRSEGLADSREKFMEFGFDFCYWSVDPAAPNYASQEEVFQDLGVSVLSGASEGYNVCLFAYGQTGSGKTYTMMGTPDSIGLTPRICQGLFRSGVKSADGQSCRVEISFLEIYNERVRDLLRGAEQKKPAPLRVREHPEKGPYVQGLSQHVVTDYKQAVDLLEEGIANRITAATHVHDASSRSHAIFTIQYTQAILENNLPSEIVSKINLVDLAGSERADPQYCRDRITEGANINKSLVTLGIVISALAQNSQMFSSSQSINSVLSEGEGSTVGSQSSSLSGSGRRQCFIPYRDSVLTWLLKDSLGGNSKTIMIATVSPSSSSYNETLSTLRYAAHARNIVNKPRVNEDANVRLIRELREEIDRLKSMLLSFEMQRNPSPSLSDEREGSLSDIVLQNELKVEQLTKDWSDSWCDKRALLERYNVDINQDRAGVLIHSLLPHLIALEPDVLSTGVTIYHLQEGVTRIGPQDDNLKEPHIVLPEGSTCEIENKNGVVTLKPVSGNICMVNEREIKEPCRLAQGAVVTLAGPHKFRFNHPAEAAVLRERRRISDGGLVYNSTELNSPSSDTRVAGAGGHENSNGTAPRQKLEEQQWYIECLREEIQMEQKRAERDLEREQARLRQQHTEIKQWILQEKQRLEAHREKGTLESGVQTDLILHSGLSSQMAEEEGSAERVPPSPLMGDRKRVVQEELLKHHALRRAENCVRRKRLHYQLEKIARKRHLLEAKRELQRLENELLQGGDEASSPDLGYPSKSRGRPMTLRRHSFSADLLSRLYPQHTPIFSQFLKRNRSFEFTTSLACFARATKWESDECLQDQKIRRRSNTMPSRYDQGSSSWASFSDSVKSPIKDASSAEATKLKTASSRLIVKKSTSDQDCLDSNTKSTRKVLPIIKQKSPVKGTKTLSQGGNKGLGTFRKVFSHSVGSGIRTALAKVFCKPPPGSRGRRSVKSVNKATSQLNEKSNKIKTLNDFERKQEKCPIKPTVSYESLEQLNSLKYKQQRHWRSAEVLTSTKPWVAVQKETARWVEHGGWEDPNRSSDCDSIFSLDSLSSAYATALAEQLQLEECDSSDAESEDSQMSQDSLGMESSGKHVTARPVLRFEKVPSHLTTPTVPASCSSQAIGNKEEIRISKDVPAEVFWSLNGSQKSKTENGPSMAKVPSHFSCLASESKPCSRASIRETENPLALTDAWSSTDAADSPRIIMASGHLLKQDPHTLIESRRCQSSTSLDLSDNMNVSESQSSHRSDSTQDENTTLEEQNSTSFENTLLLESDLSFIPGQEMDFKEQTTSAEPCTTQTVCDSTDTSSDGVAHPNKPTTENEPLNPTVTKALLINSCSKDGEISTSTTCFQVNSSREDSHVREDPSSYPIHPADCSLKSNLNLTMGYQVSTCDNAGDPEVKNSKAVQIINESHSTPSTDNGTITGHCDEENKYFYTKQCTEMAFTTDTKDYALTIEKSEKHDVVLNRFGTDGEHFGNEALTGTCEMKDSHAGFVGNVKLLKKSDEDVSDTETALLNMDQEQLSACSTINGESVKNTSLLENWLTADTMENSDQELEDKKIKNAPLARDDHKTLISKDHINTFRNDSVCDSGLTQTNCTSLKSLRSSEIENIIDNSKEDRKDECQITERKANNRYFQMSDSAINDNISEVVKEHFMMSLREDCSEDQESNTKKENTYLAKLDDFKFKTNKHEFDNKSTRAGHGKSNSSQTFSCMSKSEINTDNSTVHLENSDSQTELRHSLTMKDQAVSNSSGTEDHIVRKKENKKVEQENPKCGYVSDNMESVLYCTIEEQSTDKLKTSESVLSCVRETIIDVNTSRENIIVCTQLRKDNVDASNPVQRKDCISERVLEGGRATVLKPMLPCMYAQDTLSLKLTNGLEKVQKVNQCMHRNAQVVDNKTERNKSGLASMEMHNFDDKPLTHRHSRLLNETLCSPSKKCPMKVSTPVKSSNWSIPQVLLSTEATVKHTVSGVHSEDVADTFQQTMEAQNKKICSYNSSVSSIEHYHSTVYGNYPTPVARPSSNLAFYEFGPGNLGKHNGCVSQDKTCAKHSVETATISSNCDENKERPVEHIHNGNSEDLRKDATLSDLSQAPPSKQMHKLLKTCDSGKIDKDPQSENQSIYTSNQMEMEVTSQYNDERTQSFNNQPLKNQELNMSKNHQSTCMQRRVPDKSVEVYHNAEQTHCSQNTKEYYNSRCKSTEHVTAAEATKHFVGNGNDERRKGKQKRYRKAHFIAPPSSSTDSTSDLSLDESTTSKGHVSRTKPASQANLLPTSQNALGKYKCPPLDEQSISSPSTISPRSLEEQSGQRYTQQPSTGMPPSMFGVAMRSKAEAIACQQDYGSKEEMRKIEMTESNGNKDIHLRKNASSEDILACVEDHAQPFEDTVPQTRDSAMHFASSDINPFIHSKTTMGVNTAIHKKQAFGSAANISCKHSSLNCSNKNMTRCCSVDNGLNIQDSPFCSHLSTYVNHKGLSSTLSSNEYSKYQISSEPLLKAASHSSSGSKKQTLTVLKCDSYNCASAELRHSSGQVGEIVLVYSSEYESQEHPSPSRCDHGTQTIEVNKDLKRKSRHRRSSTQTPVSKPGNGALTTWASLQNMSEHLSDLIVNTSDLLGNIQGMRTGEKPPKYDHPEHCFQVSTVHSCSNFKKDCSTQTSLDIGIQTEDAPVSKNAMAHEVNVIVKVIGSNTCNVSQLDGDAKILKNKCESEQAFERIKSLPDLRPKGSNVTECQNFLIPSQKVLSLETVVPNQDSPSMKAFEGNTVDYFKEKSSSSHLGAKRSHMKQEEKQNYHRNVDLRNCFNKQIMLMDRACSPILTVKAARYTQERQVKTTQSLTNHKTEGQEKRYSNVYNMPLKGHKMSNRENKVLHSKNARTASTSVSSATFENLSDLCPNLGGSDDCSNSICPCTKRMNKERNEYSHEVEDWVISKPTINRSPSQPQKMSLSLPSSTIAVQLASSSDNVRQSKMENLKRSNLSTVNSQLSHRSTENIIKSWDHSNQSIVQQQEDDVMSLVPSECNTDVLVSINPLAETSTIKEHQWIPDDLPMHNKFTNWSGINQQPPSTLKIHRPTGQHFTKLSPSYWQELSWKTDRRAHEIEKLRKERERVLASVHMDLSPHQLTVELTEAKLHYGQGETDTLLKILKSGSKEASSACNKQELLNRHRKSIESLRKDREARLQMCRRARSLSPSKHRIPIHYEEQSQKVSELPSRHREYLQQLRQEIVETSRVPDPPRREGQCPSDIEHLLRDYSLAREEARAEIARARDRLRERTEQEKRRLQQQALSQAVKDDLRFRTRISNSTLCSGSNLSLSSSPTSGYNSSNTALLKDITSPLIQVNGVSEFKVRTRPPVIPLQTSKAQCRWLSVQDVSLETSATGYEPESSSTPSSPPCARQRTLSFGSPSSISTSYLDIADCTLAGAISEVYLASGGDVRNLLAGKAAAGWRHQGVEKGVQVFHKATSRPSAHGFLGAVELERPLASLWSIVRDHSKTHLYHESIKSAWTRPLDESTQLVYLLMDVSNCQLKQPRDFCCLSTESKQDDMWVLAMQSVFEETLPRPSVDTIRGEILPSAWILQPSQRNSREVVTVIYLLQVDLGSPSLAPRLLNTVSRKQAAVIADLDSFFSL
ncbi:stAR-related lipid transfer protein 9-like [Sinocyclocheilus anshuiensis]|uniref:stAR-related lipid transfer protein 9-like n=1 Tax=Sinocyclocheilus anshuiensis TaxID=1608454 RepID=UPI0007BA6648|nr:PREDICTED: stAR-related lipid transfer protein 9-like [Sinocyclocheilus anshuiensis]